jgi:predicted  nucleic acid-binding Zn-ribbon protein
MHGAVMKVDADYLRYVLGGVIADENQKLLLKLEELVMSSLTPMIQSLQAKVHNLKASNDAMTAAAVEKDVQISDLHNQLSAAQAALSTAQANGFDAADVQALQDILNELA